VTRLPKGPPPKLARATEPQMIGDG